LWNDGRKKPENLVIEGNEIGGGGNMNIRGHAQAEK
jgi:hypothetical protein